MLIIDTHHLPAHHFETKDSTKGVIKFNLIDVIVSANNTASI